MKIVETPKSPRVWQEVTQKRARATVETEVALPVLRARPTGQLRGERINDLSPLPPESHFRAAMLKACRIFVREQAKKRSRFVPTTPEADFRIYGPYQHYDHRRSTNLGSLWLPQGQGRQGDEWADPAAMDFLIIADFVAEYGFVTPLGSEAEAQSTASAAVAVWQAAERAAGNDI